MNEGFRKFAARVADLVGHPLAFTLAGCSVAVWLLLGPGYGFSEKWQLAYNTGVTITTFLMVFIIQNAQNRNAKALHLKLDELLRAAQGARTSLVNLQQLSDEELKRLEVEFERLHTRERAVSGLAIQVAQHTGEEHVQVQTQEELEARRKKPAGE